MITGILLAATVIFLLAYCFYGKRVARFFISGLDDELPSVALRDDMYYFPRSLSDLLTEHFTCIAGPGVVLGALVAGIGFGWVPALLWLVLGSIFVGGIHDLGSICFSLKHDGLPLYEIVRRQTKGELYKVLLSLFLLMELTLAVCYVDLAATVMSSDPAVFFFAVCFFTVSVILGILSYIFHIKLSLSTLVAAPVSFGVLIWCCNSIDMSFAFGVNLQQCRVFVISLIYLFGILPSWLLMNPANYLSGKLIFVGLGIGFAGVFLGGWDVTDAVALPAFGSAFGNGGLNFLWPMMFVSVACGAISGFHGITGTIVTSKQIKCKEHILPVSYGAMLLEALIGVMALCMVMKSGFGGGTNLVDCFAAGFGTTLSVLGIPLKIAVTFGGVFLNLLILNTVGSAFQMATDQIKELCNYKISGNVAAMIAIAVIIFVIALYSRGSTIWQILWLVFGSANFAVACVSMFYVWLAVTYFCKVRKVVLSLPVLFLLFTSLAAFGVIICSTPDWFTKVICLVFVLIIVKIFFFIHSKCSLVNLLKF